jgi:hypothetical protein
MTIQEIEDKGLILFKMIAGSKAYGTDIPTSDTDIRGVFILPQEDMYGLNYIEQVNDEKNDIVFYELKRFIELLMSNNPNILELIAAPEDCILYKHPIFDMLLAEKEKFITTRCKLTFGGYAQMQIKKARGLNKKIVNPVEIERKSPLDFCYVPDEHCGSIPVNSWLKEKVLNQENCGLSAIPHMKDMYHLFYNPYHNKALKYKGIINNEATSNDISLSSIPKDEKSLIILYYNKNGYITHCKDYKEYWDWVGKRNPHRYNDNIKNDQGFDSKNMLHCHRLLDMSIEIAKGEGVKIRRPNREELLKIRRGEISYDELLRSAEEKQSLSDKLFEGSSLPNKVDVTFVHNLLILMRKAFYKS